jgi:hypothetical protein
MNALKEYFSFEMILSCGIPAVIMEGTQADWQKLKEFYEYFKNFLKDIPSSLTTAITPSYVHSH